MRSVPGTVNRAAHGSRARRLLCHGAYAILVYSLGKVHFDWADGSTGGEYPAEAALEEALVHRFGALGRIHQPLALLSEIGLAFSSRHYTEPEKAYGLTQEFTTPYTPEKDGLFERFFRSLIEECIWQHRFEFLGQARAVIGRWIRYYNEERQHQSLGYFAPRAHPALAA